MQRRQGSLGYLEIGLISTTCLAATWGVSGCSETETGSDNAAGSGAIAGSTNAIAGTSASTAGATSSAGGGTTTGGSSQASSGAAGASSAGATSAGASSGGAGGGERAAEATCTRWKADTANVNEGTWSGAVDGCNVGDISAEGRENALRLFNLIRWLADLPAVVTEDARNQQAQACALMMTANDMLSHSPPMNWKCYSELGAEGARTSNISSGPGVSSVLGYMIDNGNETTFGHRRIILANELGPIGLGSAGKDGASCMQNIGGKGDADKAWMAWPPPGAFPVQAYGDRFSSLDDTGWSIQSKGIDLSAAQVTITSAGQPRPVKVEQLTGNYGNTKAIRIVLDGWQAAAGSTYAVSVTGTATPIAYEIQLVDCK